ncbi:MAG TPA: DNA methyltransferase [Geothrix sp.]
MPLNPLIAPSRLDQLLTQVEVPDALRAAALEWADRLDNYQGGVIKEQANRSQFLNLVFQQGLGYLPNGSVPADQPYTMREEHKTEADGDRPDASFGRFGGAEDEAATYAVFELKDGGTDLDKAPKGPYAMSPVQQGFSYADKHAHAEFILVSNFREIRLYARETRQLKAWVFEFHRLQHEDRERVLQELAFFLSPANLIPARPGQRPRLLEQIQAAPLEQERITRAFYQEFRAVRDVAQGHYQRLLEDQNDPQAPARALLAAQKLLNRTLFAGFAQSRHLLPDGLLADLREHTGHLEEKPLHRNLQMLFKHLDKGFRREFRGGHAVLEIQAFNGGLFRKDETVDGPGFALTEDLAKQLLHLADRDFVTELPISVLGHCFESSLGDLDAARGERQDTRHSDGIYYTPDWVTRYICRHTLRPLVERCLGQALEATAQTLGPRPDGGDEAARWTLQAFHTAWNAVADLRIVDPACGSGAFLAMGLRVLRELLEPAYRQALAAASSLPDVPEDAVHDDMPGFQILQDTPRSRALAGLKALPPLERCFYGVDLHAEAALLAQLSLWLESATPGRKLANLGEQIRVANSLTVDWRQLFPEVEAFDAVIGNPPYVRMELFKEQKPHLKQAFPDVHQERADLYCYFFQLSAGLLRDGGRYGIIVSNKWLRAQYGQPSRAFLKARFQLDRLLDLGELPVFKDATTYPMVLQATKRDSGTTAPLRFAQIPRLPQSDADLETLDAAHGHAVPADQLGEDTWLLVDEARGAAFATRKAKGIPLREYLGETPICWGIKTGLNDAFWLTQDERDALVAKNPEAAQILKPLVIGDEVRRWALRQDEPRFLVYTPKNRYTEAEFNDRFPAVAKHLKPFRTFEKNGKTIGLDHRATKQAWFELQQAQEAYEGYFSQPKVVWPEMAQRSRFACLKNEAYPNNKCFFIPREDWWLLGILNSSMGERAFLDESPSFIQGNTYEWRENVMARITLPSSVNPEIAALARQAVESSRLLESNRGAFLSFLRQDAPWQLTTVGEKLEAFWELDEATALAEALKRRNKQLKEPTLGDRDFLKRAWREAREPILELRGQIAALETELDAAVDAAWEA